MSSVFVSWSGGKDSCLAYHRAIASGLKVCYLANTVTEDGQRSRSHGISAGVLKVQAQALGIPLVQCPTGWDNYEAEFKKMLRSLKQAGVELDRKVLAQMAIEDADAFARLVEVARAEGGA